MSLCSIVKPLVGIYIAIIFAFILAISIISLFPNIVSKSGDAMFGLVIFGALFLMYTIWFLPLMGAISIFCALI